MLFMSCKGAAGPGGPAGANTSMVVFQQGISPSDAYTGCSDTILSGGNTVYNYGAWNMILFGLDPGTPYRILIKFDVSSIIPSNVTVTNASLTLSYQLNNGSNTVTAYALTRDFTEGTEIGGNAGTGASWSTYDGTNSWTAAGGDYGAAAVSNSVFADGTKQVITLNLDKSIVQGWITSPSSNYGIILIASDETSSVPNWVRFYSKEYATPAMRPALTVTYKLP